MATDPRSVLVDLLSSQRSLAIATLDDDGGPAISYTPFVRDPDGCFYVLVSALAPHTAAMARHPMVAVMVIADEANSSQIYARARAIFRCQAEPVPRDGPAFRPQVDALAARLGPVIGVLRELGDFVLYRLKPEAGRLIVGFGQAFTLTGPSLDQLTPIDPGRERPS